VWASTDYLLWWTKGAAIPPLVVSNLPAAHTSGIGPDTTILLGNSNINYGATSGVRFALGFWIDDNQTVGLEGGGLFLDARSNNFSAGNGNGFITGGPTIERPFFDVVRGIESSELVDGFAFKTGIVNAQFSSRLAGGEINGIFNACSGCGYRVDLLAGFRYLQLNDGLGITENSSVVLNIPFQGGNTFALLDQFDTTNRFYGGQFGVRGEVRHGRLVAEFTAKLALGTVDEIVDINGGSILRFTGGLVAPSSVPPTTVVGGLLALPTNIGHHTQSRFAAMPEAGLNVGYQLMDCLRVYVGYDLLYLSNAVRPGDQIDLGINTSQVGALHGNPSANVSPARPAFSFNQTDFWAQGIRFGVALRF
jgi:hypothetical protein